MSRPVPKADVMTNPTDGKPSLPRYKDEQPTDSEKEKGSSEKCETDDSGYVSTEDESEISASLSYKD